ncbi:hypothetical protein Ppa06_66870 [Planomonospora parontospora subsp. parontospora]|uniref:Uncharacterized protein n=2 Tax=Planomonospora parontospora TaxID=58119 RepID=A0AA37F8K9_9ACTN|nr:hypothetical protein [Planomonospora parontospora]GGK98649.1 hypothetical protein GCM10010126_67550 [Planomonospora parontospora]GII12889.1 hypothetical protein Ppa06_66870 [Planomonospora parontospora subsp. parontospora]
MIDIIGRWRAFEKTLRDREFDWGSHFAPAQLRYARSAEHPRGAGVDHLLPADYRAFVSEVGYPVIGFGYYDRDGISFFFRAPAACCLSSGAPFTLRAINHDPSRM